MWRTVKFEIFSIQFNKSVLSPLIEMILLVGLESKLVCSAFKQPNSFMMVASKIWKMSYFLTALRYNRISWLPGFDLWIDCFFPVFCQLFWCVCAEFWLDCPFWLCSATLCCSLHYVVNGPFCDCVLLILCSLRTDSVASCERTHNIPARILKLQRSRRGAWPVGCTIGRLEVTLISIKYSL